MKFNELQSTLWLGMIESIESFRMGKLSYSDLIYGLEGALDSGGYQDDKLIKLWYDYWTPLEILYTKNGDGVTYEDATIYLSNMGRFLRDISSKS